jgi:hypothetical protein
MHGEAVMLGASSKKRVYICSDLIHDKKLLDFVVLQSKKMDSPFYVVDYSKPWQPPEKEWRENLKRTISLAELVFIMVGKKTFKAPNVLEEVDIAYNLGKPILQFCDPNATFAECKPLPKGGKLYQWEWENLKIAMRKFQYVSHI